MRTNNLQGYEVHDEDDVVEAEDTSDTVASKGSKNLVAFCHRGGRRRRRFDFDDATDAGASATPAVSRSRFLGIADVPDWWWDENGVVDMDKERPSPPLWSSSSVPSSIPSPPSCPPPPAASPPPSLASSSARNKNGGLRFC